MSDASGGRGGRRRFGRKDVQPTPEDTGIDAEYEAAVHQDDGIRRGHGQFTPSANEPLVAEWPDLGDQLSRERDEASHRAVDAETRCAELEAAQAGHQERSARSAGRLTAAEAQIAELTNELAVARQGAERRTNDHNEMAAKLAALTGERDELAAARDELQHDLDLVMRAADSIEEQLRRWADRLPPAPQPSSGS